MKANRLIVILVIAAIAVGIFVLAGPFYILEEGQMAVVVQLGKIVAVQTEAGLKFRSPFLDIPKFYPKKIMPWDGESRQIQTSENQLIWVDTTARWRIVDPAKFYASINELDNVYGKLDDIIDNAVRTVISKNRLSEAVRSTNYIQSSKSGEVFQTGDPISDEALKQLTQSDNLYEAIAKGRRKLSEDMLAIVKPNAPDYGIEVIDIVIREIAYTEDQINNIYERMTKERSQIAQAYRSFGEGKKAEWLGKLENEKRSILSEAYQKAETFKGKADAEASRIYAESYNKDSGFYEFWRAIESYRLTMPRFNKTMTTDLDYFRYLYSPEGR
ncbi:MAG: protease modulator HflC [Spirochaetes bacterium]|nr:protease modulator HflC [Spirochaetota bacterium]